MECATFDECGYPTEESLEKIEEFDLGEHFGRLPELINFIYRMWEYSDVGAFEYHADTGCLELHTYGWSGNESVMTAIKNNMSFFRLFWYKSKRGGHYWFKLYMFDEDGKKRLIPEIDI